MKKKKYFIIASILFLFICVVVVYGFFSAPKLTQSADSQTGIVNVKLFEEFLTTGENSAPVDRVKTFWGSNTGNKMAYVRAHLFPSPEFHYTSTDSTGSVIDEWRPLNLPLSAFNITIDSPDWISSSDGYLYYSNILNPGELTTEVTINVEIEDASVIPNGTEVRLNMRVELESAQVTNNMYRKTFDITDLPNGVEVLTNGGVNQ